MIQREKLDNIYKEMLEEKIIDCLAETKNISIRKAMDIYYHSRLSQQINDGSYGIENMDYRYLVQDLIENEPELFRRRDTCADNTASDAAAIAKALKDIVRK